MGKLTLAFAIVMPLGSLLLAKHAVDEMPLRVEVDGHPLRVHVTGEGSPAVVMEIGLGGVLEEWGAVQGEVARFTRVFSYDRSVANYGRQALVGSQVAVDLHDALEKASVWPPYVLVGQSFGGTYNRVFASMYPKEVAGLVLLDPSQETFIQWMDQHHPERGLAKMGKENPQMAASIVATLEELKTCGPLPNVPVVVVTCARPSGDRLRTEEVLPAWTASHEAWVKTLPQGRHVITEKSGHGIQVEQPELVVDLIREMVEQVRKPEEHKERAISGSEGTP